MAWLFGRKDEPVENRIPEQSERQYNLFWMIRMSPFAEHTDQKVQEAIDRKVREVERTLRTNPVDMVKAKSERKVEKLKTLSGDAEAIARERDEAILHFNRNMLEDTNGQVPTDPSKIAAIVAREGWADGTGLVDVEGMPHCPRCGYINRRTKLCVNCGTKLKRRSDRRRYRKKLKLNFSFSRNFPMATTRMGA